MAEFYDNSIYWIEVEKIKPNPFQPRREFDEGKLKDLADSIRMYGVLQPLVVTRKEISKEDGGLAVEYELISGERRLRASTMAGVAQVPVIIRADSDDDKIKLELAVIENLQREDLNAVDRAKAFDKLHKEFHYKATDIAERIGKSREYVANTMRILNLPEHMTLALAEGKITEGHTRPLLMLIDKPEEQETLFKEILLKRLSVREAEGISRRIAHERARKKDKIIDPQLIEMQTRLTETLGTRVLIERNEMGGKVVIDFFSPEDLSSLLQKMESLKNGEIIGMTNGSDTNSGGVPSPIDDSSSDDELYSVKNFSV